MTDDADVEDFERFVRLYLAGKLTAGEFTRRLATDRQFRDWFRGGASADLEAEALARQARQHPRHQR